MSDTHDSARAESESGAQLSRLRLMSTATALISLLLMVESPGSAAGLTVFGVAVGVSASTVAIEGPYGGGHRA